MVISLPNTSLIGKSERLLGSFIRQTESAAVVMTKYAPFPWRFGRKSIVNALRRSLLRLGIEQVHLYMIHWEVNIQLPDCRYSHYT